MHAHTRLTCKLTISPVPPLSTLRLFLLPPSSLPPPSFHCSNPPRPHFLSLSREQNATTFSEKASAYTAWIDSESAYREALAKKDTALSAVTYAQGKFDEYSTAVTAGEASYAETIAPMAAEKEDLIKQQEMIAQIVELIQGMAQPSAAKSVKAANLAQVRRG
jgi:hypothetical protein